MLIGYENLPELNAILNATAALTIWTAHRALERDRNIEKHKRLMILGVILSALYLVSYVVYHIALPPYTFQGPSWARAIYFPFLASHILLAIAIVPMVLITLMAGLKSRFDRHKRLAKWTYPLWMYVSVTGVLIYLARYLR